MKYAKTLLNIIQGSQSAGSPVVVYCNDQKELVSEVYGLTGVLIKTKQTPDNYETWQGYTWQRINRRQLTLKLNNGIK